MTEKQQCICWSHFYSADGANWSLLIAYNKMQEEKDDLKIGSLNKREQELKYLGGS